MQILQRAENLPCVTYHYQSTWCWYPKAAQLPPIANSCASSRVSPAIRNAAKCLISNSFSGVWKWQHVKRRQELWDLCLNAGCVLLCFSTHPATYLAQHQHHVRTPIHNETGRRHALSPSSCEKSDVGVGFSCIGTAAVYFFPGSF